MAGNQGDQNDSAINWESQEVAERRNRGRARRAELQGPATQMMLDLAEVRIGGRVLDVAAGTGDQTLMAAERVRPTGYVFATDISASMLKLAADAAREAGFTNVETRVMEAENVDLDADSLRRGHIPAQACFCFPIRRTCLEKCAGWFGQEEKLRHWLSRRRKKIRIKASLWASLAVSEAHRCRCSPSAKPPCSKTPSGKAACAMLPSER